MGGWRRGLRAGRKSCDSLRRALLLNNERAMAGSINHLNKSRTRTTKIGSRVVLFLGEEGGIGAGDNVLKMVTGGFFVNFC